MRDRVTLWFVIAVVLVGVVYAGFELTPSSYGVFLETVGGADSGPVVGVARGIRSDEWSIWTPLFQIAVRNHFERINETSIYHEDLRNFIALPLKDWSLLFKPQMWAFFVTSPALALSIYFAIFMCAFLIGYHLLFIELGTPTWLAASASAIVYFSGFTQFWWTTYGPSIAVLPWVLLVILKPMPWWKKFLILTWLLPAFALAHLYPPLLLTMAWCGVIMVLAFRPRLLTSPGELAAIAIAGVIGVLIVYFYFGDVATIMSHTVYPGRRIAQPGETPLLVALSGIFPSATFRISDYQNLTGANICEIGAVGSFLPLLTLCLTRYKALRRDKSAWLPLIALTAAFISITIWTVAPVPMWIGNLLLWNRMPTNRWLFILGLLLTIAALVIWNHKLISFHPLRIAIFVLLGPVAIVAFKIVWLTHRGVGDLFSECRDDILLCGFAALVAGMAWFAPAERRGILLVFIVVFINLCVFGRFNPMQPAGPIFDPPETDAIQNLRNQAAASPGGVLVNTNAWAGTLNGIGIRSINHILLAPRLDFFRQYFPTMDPERFDWIFDRYARIHVADQPLPGSIINDTVDVPMEVFLAVRNVRKIVQDRSSSHACAQPAEGAVERVSSDGPSITIEGWAPWRSETNQQEVRIFTTRSLAAEKLTTITRPDIAEKLEDYAFVKAGFRLQISSADGKPIRPEELALFATGTPTGDVRIACCACP